MSEIITSNHRTLVERLRANAQGISLGAEGMGWGPEDLYAAAADEIERRDRELKESVDHEVEYKREIERLRAEFISERQTLGSVVTWLERQQPDVFRKGLWGAIIAARRAWPSPSETEVSPPADPPDVAHILDLLAWAHSKLRAFGVHTGKPESAMRMDAIEFELRAHPRETGQSHAP